MSPLIEKYLFRHKAFWVALLFSIAIWFISAMSDIRQFDASVKIEWVGYDTARYVKVSSDSVIRITMACNSFSAIGNLRATQSQAFRIETPSDTTILSADCDDRLASQLNLHGIKEIECKQERLSLRLAERKGKAFAPLLKGVELSFVEQYGLCGTPQVMPDTIWLYGSEASLAKIDALETMPTHISDISATDTYAIALRPVWQKHPDLHPSATHVKVAIPTSMYVEKSYMLPIKLDRAQKNESLRIYPEQARVTLWMPDNDNYQLAIDMIELSADYTHRDTNSDQLNILAKRFPSYVRIKSIEPSTVKYVIIKK